VLLGFTQSSDNAVLSFQPVTTRRQFVILVGLNTSQDKMKLIFDLFSFVLPFTNHATIDYVNGAFFI